MSTEGQRLGMAIAEHNTPIARTQITFRGEALGHTARDIAELANKRAYEFFGDGIAYELDIDVGMNPYPKPDADSPLFQGIFSARSV
jgi:hypothetical protein